jgi:hypothetical protein
MAIAIRWRLIEMLKNFKRGAAAHRLLEEKIYEYVALEMQNGIRRDGLWAKALVLGEGSEEKARSNYIMLRVRSLKDEAHIEEAIEERFAKLIVNADISLVDKTEPTKEDADIREYKLFPQDYMAEIIRAKHLVDNYPRVNASIEIHDRSVRLKMNRIWRHIDSIENFREALDLYGFIKRA